MDPSHRNGSDNMKRLALIAIGLLVMFSAGAGCKKKAPQLEPFQHTPENTHRRIQELRIKLKQAVERNDLRYVHDMMNYFKGLLRSLSVDLPGERKQRMDAVIRDLTIIAEQIDNSAGRGNQAATEANLTKLVEKLKELESEFRHTKT
jgi:hypothetical protein